MTKSAQIRNLAALAQRRAHIDAVRRLQTALLQELRSAGIRGADVDGALVTLNQAISAFEEVVGANYDDQLFALVDE